MKSRLPCAIIIFIVIWVIAPIQPAFASASGDCKPETFNWGKGYQISKVKRTGPTNPIIKQQLEDLYTQGNLSKPPEEYANTITASISIDSGMATYHLPEEVTYIEPPYKICTALLESEDYCYQEEICKPFQEILYRSIREMRVFLIPDINTTYWISNGIGSPKIRLAFPDYWVPVIDNGGGQVSNWWEDQQGLHFLQSNYINGDDLPTYLPTTPAGVEIPDLLTLFPSFPSVGYVISLCDVVNGEIKNYSNGINADYKYECEKIDYSAERTGYESSDLIQSVGVKITKLSFDIPGNYAIGVVAIVDLAYDPHTDGKESDVSDPINYSNGNNNGNYSDDSYYENTAFTVWMIVNTPCTNAYGGNGCDLYLNP